MINEETRIQDPVDISYVYNGYSPLSVKFIELCMQAGGFSKIEDKLKALPGPHDYPSNEADFFAPRPGGSTVQD